MPLEAEAMEWDFQDRQLQLLINYWANWMDLNLIQIFLW